MLPNMFSIMIANMDGSHPRNVKRRSFHISKEIYSRLSNGRRQNYGVNVYEAVIISWGASGVGVTGITMCIRDGSVTMHER